MFSLGSFGALCKISDMLKIFQISDVKIFKDFSTVFIQCQSNFMESTATRGLWLICQI